MPAAAAMNADAQLALGVLFLVECAASLAAWTYVGARLRAGRPPLAFAPRRDVPWSIVDMAVAVGVWYGLLVTSTSGLARMFNVPPLEALDEATPEALTPFLLANAIAGLGSVVVMSVFVRLRVRATAHDLGFVSHSPRRDVWLGLVAMAAAILPTQIVYFVVLNVFQLRRENHPVERLMQDTTDGLTTAVVVFTAVVAAPVAEEFLFRGLLQGWLEKVLRRIDDTVVEQPPADEAPGDAQEAASPDASPLAANDEAPPHEGSLDPETRRESPSQLHTHGWPMATIAIVLSSGLFGLVHISVWPTPIPLFVFGLVVGYVYYRTHRLLPCIVLHMSFNAIQVVVMGILKLGEPPS